MYVCIYIIIYICIDSPIITAILWDWSGVTKIITCFVPPKGCFVGTCSSNLDHLLKQDLKNLLKTSVKVFFSHLKSLLNTK